MNGKWDHSTKPSTYKLLDKEGKIWHNVDDENHNGRI